MIVFLKIGGLSQQHLLFGSWMRSLGGSARKAHLCANQHHLGRLKAGLESSKPLLAGSQAGEMQIAGAGSVHFPVWSLLSTWSLQHSSFRVARFLMCVHQDPKTLVPKKQRAMRKTYHLLSPSTRVIQRHFCTHRGSNKGLPRFNGRKRNSTTWWRAQRSERAFEAQKYRCNHFGKIQSTTTINSEKKNVCEELIETVEQV